MILTMLPRSVRVKWFVGPPNFTALMDQKFVYHDFPLEPSGALNYETVKRRWNLSQNCFVSGTIRREVTVLTDI